MQQTQLHIITQRRLHDIARVRQVVFHPLGIGAVDEVVVFQRLGFRRTLFDG
jgi:hypothetical protein